MVQAGHIRVTRRSVARARSQARSQSRKAKARSLSLSTVFAGFVLCVVCLATGITARQAELARIGYEIGTLKKELAVLQAEHQLLDVEVARLQSFDRVESAAAELGMHRPDEIRMVYTDASSTPQTAVADATVREGFTSYLARATRAVLRVATGVMGAEAHTLK